jgi:hypothetical protein
MAVESIRGCGYRKVGGLYVVGGGFGIKCDRLPYELETCPACGSGIKFTRGFQWLDWSKYAGQHFDESGCRCMDTCPVCHPATHYQPYGLMWVGSEYTPESFAGEAAYLGVSKRIPSNQIPRKLKLGESWIILAHNYACGTRKNADTGADEGIPGVFYAFRPLRLELLIWKSEAKPEYLEELEHRGITPVIIPDGDLDHDPKTPLKPDENAIREAETKRFFAGLRSKIGALRRLEDAKEE